MNLRWSVHALATMGSMFRWNITLRGWLRWRAILTVTGRTLGSRTPLFAEWSIPIPPTWHDANDEGSGGTTLRDVITAIVHAEVDAFAAADRVRVAHAHDLNALALVDARGDARVLTLPHASGRGSPGAVALVELPRSDADATTVAAHALGLDRDGGIIVTPRDATSLFTPRAPMQPGYDRTDSETAANAASHLADATAPANGDMVARSDGHSWIVRARHSLAGANAGTMLDIRNTRDRRAWTLPIARYNRNFRRSIHADGSLLLTEHRSPLLARWSPALGLTTHDTDPTVNRAELPIYMMDGYLTKAAEFRLDFVSMSGNTPVALSNLVVTFKDLDQVPGGSNQPSYEYIDLLNGSNFVHNPTNVSANLFGPFGPRFQALTNNSDQSSLANAVTASFDQGYAAFRYGTINARGNRGIYLSASYSIPTPGAAALLGIGGLLAARRRR